MNIVTHPVLGNLPQAENVAIYFKGKKILARDGQTVAAALISNGIYQFGHSRNLAQSRGLYCGNGRCQSCLVTIDGINHIRSCQTLVRDGMVIETAEGDPDVRSDAHEN
jgi:sarcosine oxidase subunit alpha